MAYFQRSSLNTLDPNYIDPTTPTSTLSTTLPSISPSQSTSIAPPFIPRETIHPGHGMPAGRTSYPYRRPMHRSLYSGLTLPSAAPAKTAEQREKKRKYESSSEESEGREETAGKITPPESRTKHPSIEEDEEVENCDRYSEGCEKSNSEADYPERLEERIWLEDPLEGPIDEVVMDSIEKSVYGSVEEEERNEEEEAAREQKEKDEEEKEEEEKATIDSAGTDLPAQSSPSGLQNQKSSGQDSQGADSSMDSLVGLQATAESGSRDSSRQQEDSYDFEYPKDHSCCIDSLRESDTSYWNSSREHNMESEIMLVYNLPAIPKPTDEIPEMTAAGSSHEICEDDFARAYRANREEFEQERKRWHNLLSGGRKAFIESRDMHVAYIQEREGKRAAREPVRKRRS